MSHLSFHNQARISALITWACWVLAIFVIWRRIGKAGRSEDGEKFTVLVVINIRWMMRVLAADNLVIFLLADIHFRATLFGIHRDYFFDLQTFVPSSSFNLTDKFHCVYSRSFVSPIPLAALFSQLLSGFEQICCSAKPILRDRQKLMRREIDWLITRSICPSFAEREKLTEDRTWVAPAPAQPAATSVRLKLTRSGVATSFARAYGATINSFSLAVVGPPTLAQCHLNYPFIHPFILSKVNRVFDQYMTFTCHVQVFTYFTYLNMFNDHFSIFQFGIQSIFKFLVFNIV